MAIRRQPCPDALHGRVWGCGSRRHGRRTDPVDLRCDDRAGGLRDGLLAFGAAAIVYLPWLPTLRHQAGNATAPWDYRAGAEGNFPRALIGSDRVDAVLAIVVTAVACR